MMWLLWLLAFLFVTPAQAQCNGVFGANTACGTVAGGPPGPIAFSSIVSGGGLTIGTTPISSGTNNQILYETGGKLGQITLGNSCFYLTNGSGVPSCTATVGFSPLLSSGQSYNITATASGIQNPWTGTSANDAGGGGTNTWLGPGAGPQVVGGGYVSTGSLGAENVSIGFIAGSSITTGTANISIGGGAGVQLTTASRDVNIGRHAQRVNHVGTDDVIIGEFANNGNDGPLTYGIFSFTGHVDNGSGGLGSLLTVTAISGTPLLVGMHVSGGALVTNGCEIISLGTGTGGTGTYNLDCSGNTGSISMQAALVDVTQSVFIGGNAGYYAADKNPANGTDFSQSVAIGYKAYFNGFTGEQNVAIGYQALLGDATNAVTGSNNTVVGATTCTGINTGSQNTCVGSNAGAGGLLASASNNTLLGMFAGYPVTGSSNTFVGSAAGSSVTSGTNNVMVGAYTFQGPGVTTGSNNTIIGNASGLSAGLSSSIILSDGAANIQADYTKTHSGGWTLQGTTFLPSIPADTGKTDATVCEDTTNHQLFSGTGAAGICLGTSSIRFKHNIGSLVPGLAEVMKLQPVEYRLNSDVTNKKLYGFTAEQGETALPELVGKDKDGKPQTFDYMGVVPVLVKAIQQQQAEIEELKRRFK